MKSPGIHHITAITSDPQANLDFYEGFLGQRLIKQTINFDDPSAYHFYFADRSGTIGTMLTFFWWKNMPKNRAGTGEVNTIRYEIAEDAIEFWQDRAEDFDIPHEKITTEFGDTALALEDADGLKIELIVTKDPAKIDHWEAGPIPEKAALRGFFGVKANVISPESMQPVMEDGLGFTSSETAGAHVRWSAQNDTRDISVDFIDSPNMSKAGQGAGGVHHVAFRAKDEDAQSKIREQLEEIGLAPTPVIDRGYFKSVYSRTPSGILFEIATDGPGFSINESVDDFGENLQIPDEFKKHEKQIRDSLPEITLPRRDA